MTRNHKETVAPPGLIAGAAAELRDTAWLEVIEKMDRVYSDLIGYEVELEEKNAKLEDAQRFIESVQAAMSDVLIVCDRRGRVQQVNEAFRVMAGLVDAAVIGRPLSDFVAGGGDGVFERLLTVDGRAAELEVAFRGADGAPSEPVAVKASRRLDPLGRVSGYVLIGRPLGELQRAYKALEQTHRQLQDAQTQLVQQEKMASLGRLVAGVAHELNNPISFICGNVHMLAKYRDRLLAYLTAIHDGADAGEVARLRRTLKIDHLLGDLEPLVAGTKEGADRVAGIIRRLRRLSFPNATGMEQVVLAQVVTNAVNWALRSARIQAAVEFDLPAELAVRGDPAQIHQVIVNLTENALDAVSATAKPKIVFSARADGGRVRLSVADNGPGIAPENLTRIFDPFFTTKAVGQGTGLGLWIAYGIVKDHDGTIEAANGPSGGAVVTVSLPRG